MSLLEQFASLNHRQNFQPINLAEPIRHVRMILKQKSVAGQAITLADEDSLRWALFFLGILDEGGFPVSAGGSNSSFFNKEVQLKNGVWVDTPATKAPLKGAAYAMQTSGSTGLPRQFYFSAQKGLLNGQMHIESFLPDDIDEITQVLPVYHSFGVVAYIWAPLSANIGVHWTKGVTSLRPFQDNTVTTLIHVSPTQARLFLRDRFSDPQNIKKISVGAGAMSTDELDQLQQKFPETHWYVSYGLTEAGPRVTTGRWNLGAGRTGVASASWIGRPLAGIELKILDESGQLQELGKGPLCIKSPCLALNLPIDSFVDEYLLTQDVVSLTREGVFFHNRQEDLIKCGGVAIYFKDLVALVQKMPGVEETLVMKIADPFYEEVPWLAVQGSVSREEIIRVLADHLSPGLMPRRVRVFERFPRHSLDKVDRLSILQQMENEND